MSTRWQELGISQERFNRVREAGQKWVTAHSQSKITIEIEPIADSDLFDVHFTSRQLGKETFAYQTANQIVSLAAGRIKNAVADVRKP